MQKWPYADFGYIDVEHFRSRPQGKDPAHRRESLIVQAVFPSVSGNTVMFFDHYAEEYRSQRSELDEYLAKLGTDGWKLTNTGMFDGKTYRFRRYQFRRAVD